MLNTLMKHPEIDFFFDEKDKYLGHLIGVNGLFNEKLDKYLLKERGSMKLAEFFDSCDLLDFQLKNISESVLSSFVDQLNQKLNNEEMVSQYFRGNKQIINIDNLKNLVVGNEEIALINENDSVGDDMLSGRLFKTWMEDEDAPYISTGKLGVHVEGSGPRFCGEVNLKVDFTDVFNLFLNTDSIDLSSEISTLITCSQINKMAFIFYGQTISEIDEWALVFANETNRYCGFVHKLIYSHLNDKQYSVRALNKPADIEFLFSKKLISVDTNFKSQPHLETCDYVKECIENAIGDGFFIRDECIEDLLLAYTVRGVSIPKRKSIASMSKYNSGFKLNGSDNTLNLTVYKVDKFNKDSYKTFKVKFLDDISYGVFSIRIIMGNKSKVVIVDLSKLPPIFSQWNRNWDYEAFKINRIAKDGIVDIDGSRYFVSSYGQPHNGPIYIYSRNIDEAWASMPFQKLSISPIVDPT